MGYISKQLWDVLLVLIIVDDTCVCHYALVLIG